MVRDDGIRTGENEIEMYASYSVGIREEVKAGLNKSNEIIKRSIGKALTFPCAYLGYGKERTT